jgi:hypothetical protein
LYGYILISETNEQHRKENIMKAYGFKKATEFSKKQISVIYGCAKRGELKVEKWMMSNMYDLADFYGTDDNGSVEKEETEILSILESVFGHDMDSAQAKLDRYTENLFGKLTEKRQKASDRAFVA